MLIFMSSRFFPKLLSSWSLWGCVWSELFLGLSLPRCRTLHLPLLNLLRCLSAHFSSLLRSLWHSCLIYLSLLPVLCHLQTCWGFIVPQVVNEGTEQNGTWCCPLMLTAGYWPQLDFMTLTWPSSQFSVHITICSASPSFISFPVVIV